MDGAKRERRVRKREFVNQAETLRNALIEKMPETYINELETELKNGWRKLRESHEIVIRKTAGEAEEEEEDKWLNEHREIYNKVRKMFHEAGTSKNGSPKENKQTVPRMQLKKMELPKFHGDIKLYTRFKDDFKKFVEPTTHKEQLSYTLRSCLGDEPLKIVTAAEDDLGKMWKRLDDRYGKRSKLVDVIVGDLVKYKPVKEGDGKRLIEFIDLVEVSYRNLERADLQKEMANSRVVGEIERKLPEDVFKRWVRHIHDEKTSSAEDDKMVRLLSFLEEERRSVEYSLESLRNCNITTPSSKVIGIHATEVNEFQPVRTSCLMHESARHPTEECRLYMAKSVNDRIKIIKEKRACFRCLRPGHSVEKCKGGVCGKDGCQRKHHPSIHFQRTGRPREVQQNSVVFKPGGCMLMAISAESENGRYVNTIFDSGATASIVTHEAAKKVGARGEPVQIALTKVGGEESLIETKLYSVPLRNRNGDMVSVKAYGMKDITRDLRVQNMAQLARIFNVDQDSVKRPVGRVELLIGLDYANLHPQKTKVVGNLMLCDSPFGKCVGGIHPSCKHEASAGINLTQVDLINSQFLDIESIGVSCEPKCGSCKCGKCAFGAKEYTLQEERELSLIEEGLSFQNGRWISKYPWIRNPKELPDNRIVAVAKLKSLEKRLARNEKDLTAYRAQKNDMLDRGVAREVHEEEMRAYDGPVHYIAHHAVSKPESESTPLRIVFNSSASFKGHTLNDYWAKGPDLNNRLLGVLLRFRRERVALVGDIRKMYHSVGITVMDQHCHRFLWRKMETNVDPTTYCVTAVNFGDKPAATIAICALRRTAKLSEEEFPEAVKTVSENIYMDDILDSLKNKEEAEVRSEQIDRVLGVGNFKIKEWILSGSGTSKTMKVLGLEWRPTEDTMNVMGGGAQANVGNVLTKRSCLSIMNSVFDPLGLLTPVTVKAKILLRKLWGEKLGWDDPIGTEDAKEWKEFFSDLEACEKIEFQRCMKPADVEEQSNPLLVMFSDASEKAMGAVAYLRYQLKGGTYSSRLIASKSRVAPIRITSIVRLELSAAVLSVRLAKTIMEETRIDFERVLYLVDSEIVRAMVQKQSYGFKTFVATRIGEIQQASDPADWFWIPGESNVADIVSRGVRSTRLCEQSDWQIGPDFLSYPLECWPISKSCPNVEIPERIGVVMAVEVTPLNVLPINIERFSSFRMLLKVTAIIKKILQRKSFKSCLVHVTVDDMAEAESYWVKMVQIPLSDLMKNNSAEFVKRYGALGPRLRNDGIIVVGDRIKEHVLFSYNR